MTTDTTGPEKPPRRRSHPSTWGRVAKTRTIRALAAGRVLEIYGSGGGFKEVMAEFGDREVRHPDTGRSFASSDELITWAIDWYLSDPARARGAARLLATVERLAYNETTLPDLFERFKLLPAVKASDGVPAAPAVMSYRLRAFDKMTPDERASIQEVTVGPTGKLTVKIKDRARYLSLLTSIFTARAPGDGELDPSVVANPERRAQLDDLRARMMALLSEMAKPVGPSAGGALSAGERGSGASP